MSTVELAEDTLLGRRVALKRMHTPDDVRGHSRLRREALIGASLTHSNLVSIYDILTTERDDDVIVMEYVDGETLADRLRRGARADVRVTLNMLAGVSAALDAIHDQGIVHRDVKPANVLLGHDGSVKLADLGIAAVQDRTRITTDGALLGTFSYMAPEQLEGAEASPAVDVYALAAMAFEALSGQRARNEPNPLALAHAISTQPPPDLRTVWPEAPSAAADALRRAMSRDPRERPRSAGELTSQLKTALEPAPTAPIRERRPGADAPGRRPASSAGAAAAGLAPAAGRPAPSPVRRPARVPPAARARPRDRGPSNRRSRHGALLAGGLAVVLIAVAAIVLANSGGSNSGASHRPAATAKGGHQTASHTSGSGPGSASTPSGSSGSAGASGPAPTSSSVSTSGAASSSGSGSSGAPAAAGTPVAAVEAFYHLAAGHQYPAAWALADPNFRNQLGGYSSFQSGQSGDRSITFNSANVTDQSGGTASVDVRTTSVRNNGTQHCSGPVDLVRNSSGWLLDHIDINCS